jgi:hypothetical protein
MWRRSSFSTNNGGDGNCVEVAVAATVLVRDSKNATGPRLSIPATEWRSFLKDCAPEYLRPGPR